MYDRSTEMWLYDLLKELRFCLNLTEGWMYQLQINKMDMDCVRNNIIKAVSIAKDCRKAMTKND